MTQRIDLETEAMHQAGLRYISSQDKGYQRIRKGDTFCYFDHKESIIHNPKTLDRIRKLVIPPAWQEVWICRYANGHIQATGIDSRGRKQYRYHALWTALRTRDKFNNLYSFGQHLPRLEKQIVRDLKQKELTKDHVCAVALAVMSMTYFRVGNDIYEKENKSYGLTTLRNRHVKQVSTDKMFFRFIGKKGVRQQSYLKQKGLVALLAKVKEIPGQRLFQYYDKNKEITPLESGDLNNYLRHSMNLEVTCKTMRTWYACILTLQYLSRSEIPTTEHGRKDELLQTIDTVAQHLGNTRAVTRKHYIHPCLQELYLSGKLDSWIRRNATKQHDPTNPVYRKKINANSATFLSGRITCPLTRNKFYNE